MKKTRDKKKRAALSATSEVSEAELYENVRTYIANEREKSYVAVNSTMVKVCWNVGREIVEKQGGGERAAYGDALIDRLSAKLTTEFGSGYTRLDRFYVRRFYLVFLNVHTVCEQFT